jgi:hypothetical protein
VTAEPAHVRNAVLVPGDVAGHLLYAAKEIRLRERARSFRPPRAARVIAVLDLLESAARTERAGYPEPSRHARSVAPLPPPRRSPAPGIRPAAERFAW